VATVVFHGDLQRFGRRFTLYVTTAGEAIRALVMQLPGLRAHISPGHYQLRVAGADVSEGMLARRLNEPLPYGAVIHLVPRVAGAAKGGLLQIVVGAVMIASAFFTGGASIAAWGAMSAAMFAGGVSMMVGGISLMLTPVTKTQLMKTTDNGKQHTYFSSLDNAVAQGNAIPVVYGEMVVGSRVISQELMVWDE
jgi:predicted phage tail protein